MIELAVATLRADYADQPDPTGLLAEPLILRDLQVLHEAAGAAVPRDTFRWPMEPQLRATGETVQGVVGKPPRLFSLVD